MWKRVLMASVYLGVLVQSTAWAQEAASKVRIPLGTKSVSERVLRESPEQVKKSPDAELKERELSIEIYNMFTYLGETRGKVPLYSTMDGKLQLEIGVFGYLGIKWQF